MPLFFENPIALLVVPSRLASLSLFIAFTPILIYSQKIGDELDSVGLDSLFSNEMSALDNLVDSLKMVPEINPKKKFKSFVSKLPDATSGMIAFRSGYGCLDDYFGQDSANPIFRNILEGNFKYTSKRFAVESSYRLVDKKNDIGPNNFISFSLIPLSKVGKPSVRPIKLPSIGTQNYLDSLEGMVLGKKAFFDQEIEKYTKQKNELENLSIDKIKVPDSLNLSALEFKQIKLIKLDSTISKVNNLLVKINEVQNKITEVKSLISSPLAQPESLKLKKPEGFDFLSTLTALNIGRVSSEGISYNGNSVAINGIQFEGNTEKFFYAYSSGVTQWNQFFSINPINNVNQSVNQTNVLSFIRPDDGRFLNSLTFGYGKKSDNHIYIKQMYMSKPLFGADSTSNSLISNEVGFQRSFKKVKGLKGFGSIGYNSSMPSTASNSIASGLYYKVGTEYKIKKTNSSFRSEYLRVEKNAGLQELGNPLSDYYQLSNTFKQGFKAFELIIGSDISEDNLSRVSQRTIQIKQFNETLSFNPIDNLNFQLQATQSSINEWTGGISERSLTKNYVGMAQYSIVSDNDLTSRFQAQALKAEIYDFTSIQVLDQYQLTYQLQRKRDQFELMYQINKMDQDTVSMNSEILSLGWNIKLDKTTIETTVSRSRDRRSGEVDLGGGLKITSKLKYGIDLEFGCEKYVNGSFVSMLQPERFKALPYQGNIGLIKRF